MAEATAVDRELFGELYAQTARPLLGFLLRGCGDHQLAEDLLQESYLRTFQARIRFDGVAHARRYLYKVATNLLRDRHRYRRRHADVRAAVEIEVTRRDDDAAIDLDRALARLSVRDRSVLLLAYVMRMSRIEIAEVTGLKPASVGPVLHRIRTRVLRWLKQGDAR